MRNCFLLVMVVLLPLACVNTNSGKSQVNAVTQEYEIESAKEDFTEKFEELKESGGLIEDPQLAVQVQEITGKLVAVAVSEWPQTESWEWSIALFDDPEYPMAGTFGGGYIFLDKEFFESLAPTEDELAFVVAHEIAHSIERHRGEGITNSALQLLGVVALHALLGPAGGLVSGVGFEAFMLRSYHSSTQLEADEIGMRLSLAAGYDANAAVSIFEKTVAWSEQQEVGNNLDEYLGRVLVANHVLEERIANFERLSAEFSELAPGVPPTPHPVRIYYESSE